MHTTTAETVSCYDNNSNNKNNTANSEVCTGDISLNVNTEDQVLVGIGSPVLFQTAPQDKRIVTASCLINDIQFNLCGVLSGYGQNGENMICRDNILSPFCSLIVHIFSTKYFNYFTVLYRFRILKCKYSYLWMCSQQYCKRIPNDPSHDLIVSEMPTMY